MEYVVSEIWLFVSVVVTKEFVDDLFSENQLSISSTDVYTSFNYTQVDGEIHGERNKSCFNSVHYCISKL